MSLSPHRASFSRLLSPGSVALLYAALAMIWILASGSLLTMSVDDPLLQGRIEMLKGGTFVLVTSALLYSILRSWRRHESLPGDVSTPPPFQRSGVILIAAILLGTVPLAGVLVMHIHSPLVEREALSNLGAIADLKVAQVRHWLDERGDDNDLVRAESGEALEELVRWPTASASGELVLLRYEGKRAVFLGPRHSAARDAGAYLFFREPGARDPAGWVVQGDDGRGVATLAAVRLIPGTDGYLAAKIDRDEVMAPLRDLAFWIGVITFLGIAVVGAVMLAFWRQHAHAQRLELLAHSNRLMQQFYDLPFIGISMTSPESKRWVRCNDRFCEILGYPREELLALSWKDLTHPGDMALSEIENDRALRGESDGFAMEKRFVRKDGEVVHARVEVRCVRRADGSPDYLLAMLDDITEQKAAAARIERLTCTYAALSECNQSIVRCRGEDELLPRVCRIAVEHGGMKLAWIGMVDPETRVIRPVASYGEGSGLLDGVRVSSDADSPYGGGATGTAIREKRPVWVGDFQHDPMTAPWHDLGRVAGWVESCALPLEREGEVVGAFMLYSGDVAAFDDDQRALLVEMATDIGFAMTNFARERARQQAEARLDRLTHMYAALSECNQAIVRCSSEDELFPQVCRFAVQHGDMKMAWIGCFDPLAQCVEPVACFGEGTDFLADVRIPTEVQQSPLAHGVTASAVRECKPFWIQDYLNDIRTAPWQEHAKKVGWGCFFSADARRCGLRRADPLCWRCRCVRCRYSQTVGGNGTGHQLRP